MICNVCKQNHDEPLKKWCDRSNSEIEIDRLKAENVQLKSENVRLKNALEWYIDHSCDNRLGSRVAREALGRC